MSRSFAAKPNHNIDTSKPFSMTVWVPRDIWIASRAQVPNGYAGIPPCLKRIEEYTPQAEAFFESIGIAGCEGSVNNDPPSL